MVVQFSPKIFGLNAGIFRTVLGNPGIDLRTAIGPCVLFCMLLLKKRITRWLCVNYFIVCVYDILT